MALKTNLIHSLHRELAKQFPNETIKVKKCGIRHSVLRVIVGNMDQHYMSRCSTPDEFVGLVDYIISDYFVVEA